MENLEFKISGRDRDWNFARSGEPVTTFLKFQRSASPAQHERFFTSAEPAVRRNDS
jgi:hypothetical protein